jgi:imidazolonepropionase-like amidohydrolase
VRANGDGWRALSPTSTTEQRLDPALVEVLGPPSPGEVRWVLPGLLDAHRHLPHAHSSLTEAEIPELRRLEIERCLASGVTAVDDPGVYPRIEWTDKPPGIRTALCGLEGPSDWPRPRFATIVDTARAAARAVGELVDAGADFIKVFATASGRLPEPQAITATIDETVLETILGTARSFGVPVAVHCHGGPIVAACIRGGAASFEHGLYLSRMQIGEIASSGARLVMTPLVYLRRGEHVRRGLRRLADEALELGVELRLGTDSDGWSVVDEILALIDLGVPPDAAIAAATPGDSLTWEVSDVRATGAVVLAENPLRNPSVLSEPIAVLPRQTS